MNKYEEMYKKLKRDYDRIKPKEFVGDTGLTREEVNRLTMAEKRELGLARKQTLIPDNFNRVGFSLTIDAVEKLLFVLKEYEVVKRPTSMTPQFYKILYNRVTLATDEIEELIDKYSVEQVDDYRKACFELINKIGELEKENA